MPKKIIKKEEPHLNLKIEREKENKYNENYSNTLGNIFTIAIFMVKIFGRLGYQIKLQEQVLEELKKLNKGN